MDEVQDIFGIWTGAWRVRALLKADLVNTGVGPAFAPSDHTMHTEQIYDLL